MTEKNTPTEKATPAENAQRPAFDFRAHIIKISKTNTKTGEVKVSDYVPTKWRLVGLRYDHPDATVDTEMMEHDREKGFALFRARVAIPSGGYATGYGSETRQDFGDYIEKGETKALGRALAALGYGTEGADELDEGKAEADKRDYEVNQANTVKETADGRFDGRKRQPAERAVTTEMPSGDPKQMREWFTRRLLTISVVPATKADPMGLAKALAIMLSKAGLSEQDREDCYDWFTGVLSGKDMSPEQLEVFRTSGVVSRPEDLRACAEAARAMRKEG